jgi:hypothetical protein
VNYDSLKGPAILAAVWIAIALYAKIRDWIDEKGDIKDETQNP